MKLHPNDALAFRYLTAAMLAPGQNVTVIGKTDIEAEILWHRIVEILHTLDCAQFRFGSNGATRIHYIRFEP